MDCQCESEIKFEIQKPITILVSDDLREFRLIECTYCMVEHDIRDVFFLMGAPYCPTHVVTVANMRIEDHHKYTNPEVENHR